MLPHESPLPPGEGQGKGRGKGRPAQAPIGVFDSGIGGLSILRALRLALPAEDFVYVADTGFAPYGERDDAFVQGRAAALVQRLREVHGMKALVVACNTATAAGIDALRANHPELPIVGVEPALKPAAELTRSGRVAVLATRGTLASSRFQALHASLRTRADFVLVPCDGLAAAIEAADAPAIRTLCARYLGEAGPFGDQSGQVDTVVLGCTHYPFAAQEMAAMLGPAVQLVETGEPVARQTRRLLEAARLVKSGDAGRVHFESTGALAPLHAAAARWLDLQTL